MSRVASIVVLVALWLVSAAAANAASAREIDIKAQATLKLFVDQVPGGDDFLRKAEGILVFPSVLKAGFMVGGEYGEGALIVDNRTVDYYSTAGASLGLQVGVQSKAVVLLFMTREALERFRASDGWEAGVDGSVAVVEWGAGKAINSTNLHQPIVGFLFDNKGLMLNLTLEGSKFTRIDRN
ncbi:MAG: hypothetical protein HQM03_18180 [Magnetococcales bacterium]|nr:hypothetical protein [Magnetococcales bacterium]